MVASLPAVSLAGSEMWCRLWLQSEHFKRIYCPWCICASVIKDCKPVLFFSRDLERCSIQTLCHIVECHSPHRDQCTVVLDSKVCCKESRRCSRPSGFLCTGEMGEEPTSWRPGEWTVLRQYFQQRTDNLNLQQISIKLSRWVFSGLNLKCPLMVHVLNAFSLTGANVEAVEPCGGGSRLAEVRN